MYFVRRGRRGNIFQCMYTGITIGNEQAVELLQATRGCRSWGELCEGREYEKVSVNDFFALSDTG